MNKKRWSSIFGMYEFVCLVRALPTFFEAMALQRVHRQRPRSPQVDRRIFLGAHGDCFNYDLPWNEQSTGTKPLSSETDLFWVICCTGLLVGLTNGFKHVAFVSQMIVEIAEPFKLRHIFGGKYLHIITNRTCKLSSFVFTSTGYVEYHHCAMGFSTNQRPFSAAHINHRVTAMSPLNASGKRTKTQVSVFEKWVFLIHDSERCFVLRKKKQNMGISQQFVCAVFFFGFVLKYLQGLVFSVNHLWTIEGPDFWMRHDETSLSAVDTSSSNWTNKGNS